MTAEKKLAAREVEIDGEVYEIDDVRELGWGHGGHVITCGRLEWNVFESSRDAGQAARDYWKDMAENDPTEFRYMVGEETLVQWGLGRNAGPGSVGVNSLEEWLNLTADRPEERWAGYDDSEIDGVRFGEEIANALGYAEGVAYRNN